MISLICLSMLISTCYMQTITTHNVTVQSTTADRTVNRECTEDEKHFIYTSCEHDGSQWKLQVPWDPKTCKIAKPKPPEALSNCSQLCNPGEYLDIQTHKCKPCEAGTYSIGDTEFIKISKKFPEGFTTHAYTNEDVDANCEIAGWKIEDDQFILKASKCTIQTLRYRVKLAKAGWISFSAMSKHEKSVSMRVWVENDEYRSPGFKKSELSKTKEIDKHYSVTRSWTEHKLNMEQGVNIVYFQIYYGLYEEEDYNPRNAILLKDISVKGFLYSLECKPCRAGYYSKPGSSQCLPCKANTFSTEGAKVCQKCNQEQLSAAGSSKCIPRKPCLTTDYHQFWETCKNLITRSRYAWKEPHLCSDQKGVKLPKDGPYISCPPCNPGLETNGTACVFCPHGTYNNGQPTCKRCPPNTAPAPGLFYQFWTHFPNRPMHLYCKARPDNGCKTEAGWQLHDSYIGSGIGHADDAELLMYIAVKKFTKPFATLTLDFEIVDCPSGNCRLKIQLIHSGQVVDDIDTFEGTTKRQKISRMKPTYSKSKIQFLFEKKYDEEHQSFHYSTAELRIYSIEVSNVEEGGTKECETCSSNKEGDCVQCEPGSYINIKDDQCVKCPANTFIESSNQSLIGSSSCKPCIKGLVSLPGSVKCFSDCYVTVGSGLNSKTYNLSALEGSQFVMGQRFTQDGVRYIHGYNLNICGKKNPHSLCIDNVNFNKSNIIKASICRSTFLRDRKKVNKYIPQPIAIGDNLVQIVATQEEDTSYRNNILQSDTLHFLEFHFHSKRITEDCENGTTGIVKLLCDPTATGKSIPTVEYDPSWSSYFYSCTYKFKWRSVHACPYCTKSDYEILNTACEGGVKSTRYRWKKPKLCSGGVEKPNDTSLPCTVVDPTLHDFKYFIFGFFVCAILFGILCLRVHYRNGSLNYKHSRLIDANQLKDGEILILNSEKSLESNKNNFLEPATINLDSTKVFT